MSSDTIKIYLNRAVTILRYTIRIASALFFAFVPLYLIFIRGISNGFHTSALIWSFFVLCIPFGMASSVFSFPLWLSSGKTIRYLDLLSWMSALAINIHTYHTAPHMYLKLATTHALYRIISNPWPYWLIIASCAATMLFRNFARHPLRVKNLLRYYVINWGLIILSFTLLWHLTYHELVIILNIQI